MNKIATLIKRWKRTLFRNSMSKDLAYLCSVILALLSAVTPCLAVPSTPFISVSGDLLQPRLVSFGVPYPDGLTNLRYTLDGTTPGPGSSTYTGPFSITASTQINVINIAVTPPYSPVVTEFINLPTLWLNADNGVVQGTGNPPAIVSWTDSSTNGNSAVGVNNPQLNFNAINGLPGVSFASNYFALPSGFANFTKGVTLMAVIKPQALTANATILDLGNGASGDNVLLRISSSGSKAELGVYSGTSGAFAQSASALTTDEYQLVEAVLDPVAGTGTVYVNGVAGTPVSISSPANLTRMNNFVGQASAGGNFYSGLICELLVFPNAVTNRRNVEAYLLQKYAVLKQQPQTPKISVPGGTLNGPTQVVISSEPGTVIHITQDSSTPTASSPVYNGCPIVINYTSTLKAIAIKNGLSSSVASESYTLNTDQCPVPNPADTTPPSINLVIPVQSQ